TLVPMNGAPSSAGLSSANPRSAKLFTVGVLAALLLSACGGEDETQQLEQSAAAEAPTPLSGAETQEPGEQPAETDSSPEAGAEHSVELPQTPAGEAARYVLSVLNAEQDSTAEDWEGRLHQEALEELAPTDLATVINTTIRPQGPWSAVAYDGDDTQSLTRLEADSGELTLHIAVDQT